MLDLLEREQESPTLAFEIVCVAQRVEGAESECGCWLRLG